MPVRTVTLSEDPALSKGVLRRVGGSVGAV
jgi:hypothetical protein